MKKIFSFIFVVFFILIMMGAFAKDKFSWNNFKEEPLKTNLIKVLQEMNMDTSKIEGIVKMDADWNQGPKYKLYYDDEIETYWVFAYENGQIASIKTHLMDKVIYTNNNVEITNPDDTAITLEYGKLGDYGKYVTFDGKEYIRYVLPAGTYEVSALVKNSMFFIEKTKIYKNSYGYDETQTVSTNRLAEVGVKETITLQSDEWINLTMGSYISIKEVK